MSNDEISVAANYASGSNVFYSVYDPSKFNNTGATPENYSQINLIQYRMNCYGYAFCNILEGSATYRFGNGYKQQPGDFAKTSDKASVKPFVKNNPSESMNNIMSNLRLDAERFGYKITIYTPYQGMVQLGNSNRMVALVVGNTDYHFYMQHNDGTWSHKPGSNAVTNKSIASNVVLTNDNIISKANEGAYQGGLLAFLVITKSSVIDQPHTARCCDDYPACSHGQIALLHEELAGDYIQTAVIKDTEYTWGRIDFATDHDVYLFTATSTKTYTIKTTSLYDVNLDCVVYNESGAEIAKDDNAGQVNFTVTLIAGKKYYIELFSYLQRPTAYTFEIF